MNVQAFATPLTWVGVVVPPSGDVVADDFGEVVADDFGETVSSE